MMTTDADERVGLSPSGADVARLRDEVRKLRSDAWLMRDLLCMWRGSSEWDDALEHAVLRFDLANPRFGRLDDPPLPVIPRPPRVPHDFPVNEAGELETVSGLRALRARLYNRLWPALVWW